VDGTELGVGLGIFEGLEDGNVVVGDADGLSVGIEDGVVDGIKVVGI